MSNYVLTPQAVRKLRGALAATPGNSGAAGAPSPVNIDDFPPPFTVRWSASASNKQGAWVIWLPDVARLVMLKDEYIPPTGVTAEQALPAGWYTIDDAETSSDEVWLVVTITKSDNGEIVSVDAELSTSEGQATTGETVHNILVAEMETDAETGAKRVKQFVDSAVVLGGAPGDGKLTIVQGGVTLGTFTANQSDDATITIPDPPTPGNGMLTIKQGEETLGYFTANQSDDATITIPEPPEPPEPPTVNDGTLTIKQGTNTLGTFTANQATGTTVTIPEPPTQPTVNDGILTLALGLELKTFSANQQSNVTLAIPAKRLIAGTNVAIVVNGNGITISSGEGGGTTSGFSGTRRTLAETRYSISAKQLQAKYFTETWANGIMTASTIDSAWSVIPGGQAVMETV